MPTFATDKACRKLGLYLMEELNNLDTRTVVAGITDYYPFIGGEVAVESPLLCVFRGNRSGQWLKTSELNIGYYLFDLTAYQEQTGILTGVEDAIVELLDTYGYIDQCVQLDLSGLRSRRGYLPYGGLLLPNTVLSLTFTDFETIS